MFIAQKRAVELFEFMASTPPWHHARQLKKKSGHEQARYL